MADTVTVGLERPRKGVWMATVFSKEFKEQIVELHRKGGRTFMDIGKEFNLSPTTVANWVRAADKRRATHARSTAAGEQGSESDKAKIRRLERELARKEEELQILGKALAFFARRVDQ
jgi:transposase